MHRSSLQSKSRFVSGPVVQSPVGGSPFSSGTAKIRRPFQFSGSAASWMEYPSSPLFQRHAAPSFCQPPFTLANAKYAGDLSSFVRVLISTES
jgi:hypothetical protein